MAVSGGAIFLLLVVVLGIHIYIVTRPHPIDPKMVSMARIDIKQPIAQADADKIVSYLDAQPGVSHVVVNPKSDIVVFTFFPAQTTADAVVRNFKSNFSYQAERFKPSLAQMGGGCPAGFGRSASLISKVLSFFK